MKTKKKAMRYTSLSSWSRRTSLLLVGLLVLSTTTTRSSRSGGGVSLFVEAQPAPSEEQGGVIDLGSGPAVPPAKKQEHETAAVQKEEAKLNQEQKEVGKQDAQTSAQEAQKEKDEAEQEAADEAAEDAQQAGKEMAEKERPPMASNKPAVDAECPPGSDCHLERCIEPMRSCFAEKADEFSEDCEECLFSNPEQLDDGSQCRKPASACKGACFGACGDVAMRAWKCSVLHLPPCEEEEGDHDDDGDEEKQDCPFGSECRVDSCFQPFGKCLEREQEELPGCQECLVEHMDKQVQGAPLSCNFPEACEGLCGDGTCLKFAKRAYPCTLEPFCEREKDDMDHGDKLNSEDVDSDPGELHWECPPGSECRVDGCFQPFEKCLDREQQELPGCQECLVEHMDEQVQGAENGDMSCNFPEACGALCGDGTCLKFAKRAYPCTLEPFCEREKEEIDPDDKPNSDDLDGDPGELQRDCPPGSECRVDGCFQPFAKCVEREQEELPGCQECLVEHMDKQVQGSENGDVSCNFPEACEGLCGDGTCVKFAKRAYPCTLEPFCEREKDDMDHGDKLNSEDVGGDPGELHWECPPGSECRVDGCFQPFEKCLDREQQELPGCQECLVEHMDEQVQGAENGDVSCDFPEACEGLCGDGTCLKFAKRAYPCTLEPFCEREKDGHDDEVHEFEPERDPTLIHDLVQTLMCSSSSGDSSQKCLVGECEEPLGGLTDCFLEAPPGVFDKCSMCLQQEQDNLSINWPDRYAEFVGEVEKMTSDPDQPLEPKALFELFVVFFGQRRLQNLPAQQASPPQAPDLMTDLFQNNNGASAAGDNNANNNNKEDIGVVGGGPDGSAVNDLPNLTTDVVTAGSPGGLSPSAPGPPGMEYLFEGGSGHGGGSGKKKPSIEAVMALFQNGAIPSLESILELAGIPSGEDMLHPVCNSVGRCSKVCHKCLRPIQKASTCTMDCEHAQKEVTQDKGGRLDLIFDGVTKLLDENQLRSLAGALEEFLRHDDETISVTVLGQKFANLKDGRLLLEATHLRVMTKIKSKEAKSPGEAAYELIKEASPDFIKLLKEKEAVVFADVTEVLPEVVSHPSETFFDPENQGRPDQREPDPEFLLAVESAVESMVCHFSSDEPKDNSENKNESENKCEGECRGPFDELVKCLAIAPAGVFEQCSDCIMLAEDVSIMVPDMPAGMIEAVEQMYTNGQDPAGLVGMIAGQGGGRKLQPADPTTDLAGLANPTGMVSESPPSISITNPNIGGADGVQGPNFDQLSGNGQPVPDILQGVGGANMEAIADLFQDGIPTPEAILDVVGMPPGQAMQQNVCTSLSMCRKECGPCFSRIRRVSSCTMNCKDMPIPVKEESGSVPGQDRPDKAEVGRPVQQDKRPSGAGGPKKPKKPKKSKFVDNLAVVLRGVAKLLEDKEVQAYVRATERFLRKNDDSVTVIFVSQKLLQNKLRGRSLAKGTTLEVTTRVESETVEEPGSSAVEKINEDTSAFTEVLKEEGTEAEVFAEVDEVEPERLDAPPADPLAVNEARCGDNSTCAQNCSTPIADLEKCFGSLPAGAPGNYGDCASCLWPNEETNEYVALVEAGTILPAAYEQAMCSLGYSCKEPCGACFGRATVVGKCAWDCNFNLTDSEIESGGDGETSEDGSDGNGGSGEMSDDDGEDSDKCEEAIKVANMCFTSKMSDQNNAFDECASCYLAGDLAQQHDQGVITEDELALAVCANGRNCAQACGPCYAEYKALSTCSWGCKPDKESGPENIFGGKPGGDDADDVNKGCTTANTTATQCFAKNVPENPNAFSLCASCYKDQTVALENRPSSVRSTPPEIQDAVCAIGPECESICGPCHLEMKELNSCRRGCAGDSSSSDPPSDDPLSADPPSGDDPSCDQTELSMKATQCFDTNMPGQADTLFVCMSCYRDEASEQQLASGLITELDHAMNVCFNAEKCEGLCGVCHSEVSQLMSCTFGCDKIEKLKPPQLDDSNTTLDQVGNSTRETMCADGTECHDRCKESLQATGLCMIEQPDGFFENCSACIRVESLAAELMSGNIDEQEYVEQACQLRSSCSVVCGACFEEIQSAATCSWGCTVTNSSSVATDPTTDTTDTADTNNTSSSGNATDGPQGDPNSNSSSVPAPTGGNTTDGPQKQVGKENLSVVLRGVSKLLNKKQQEQYVRATQAFLREKDPTAIVTFVRQKLIRPQEGRRWMNRHRRELQQATTISDVFSSTSLEVTTEVVSDQDETPGQTAIAAITDDKVSYTAALQQEGQDGAQEGITDAFSSLEYVQADPASSPPPINATETLEAKCHDKTECSRRCEDNMGALETCFAEKKDDAAGNFEDCVNCLRPLELVNMLESGEIVAADFVSEICIDGYQCSSSCGVCSAPATDVANCAWDCAFSSPADDSNSGEDNEDGDKGLDGGDSPRSPGSDNGGDEDDDSKQTIFYIALVLLVFSAAVAIYYSVRLYRMMKNASSKDYGDAYDEASAPSVQEEFVEEYDGDDMSEPLSGRDQGGEANYYDETVESRDDAYA